MADQDPQRNTNDATMSEEAPTPTPSVPDFLASPNAVFGDEGVAWRYGKAPDYSKTRKVWEETKSMNHEAGSLIEAVENLVKNWEVEASFKPRLSDWRTINHEKYSFAMAGGPPQSAEHMIKVGTYNGIIAPNEYYSPQNSDFASSHKTFKRMMPTFAWEVLEVYSPPPRVAFRWRHWGTMKNDYVGFNDKGEKVTAKAHGGQIDIQGVTVASLDEQSRLCDLQTWMDPLEMFRQIAPKGVVNREAMNRKVDMETALDVGSEEASKEAVVGEEMKEKHLSESTGLPADSFVPHQGTKTVEEKAEEFHDAQESHLPPPPTASLDQQGAGQVLSCPVTGAQALLSAHSAADLPVDHPPSNYSEAKLELSAPEPLASEKQPADEVPTLMQTGQSIYTSPVTGHEEPVVPQKDSTYDRVDVLLEKDAGKKKDGEGKPGEAIVAAAGSEEAKKAREEMGRMEGLENRE